MRHIVILVFLSLALTGCTHKMRTEVEWDRLIALRLKQAVSKPTFIDMRWVGLPVESPEKKKDLKKEEKPEKEDKNGMEDEIMETE